MRPVLTGWFAEFAELQAGADHQVAYGAGASAFAGATYDPTSHYRAAAVFAFHEQQGLTADRLREINRRQVALLMSEFEALDLPGEEARVEPMPGDRRGGFVAIRTPRAVALSRALRTRGVLTDARGQILRLGPAPYLDDGQLRDAIAAVGEAARSRT